MSKPFKETTKYKVLQLADGSLTIGEIADCLMIHYSYVCVLLRDLRALGYTPKTRRKGYGPSHLQKATRNKEIADAIATGNYTLQSVADQYGITRERVRQLANRYGVTTRTYNAAKTAARRATIKAVQAARRAKIQATYERVRDLVASGYSIRKATEKVGLTKGQAKTATDRMNLGALTQYGRWKWKYKEEGK